jgi:ABC-type dipeptide/oligopeptide/nickel transport system permease subunit
VARLARHRAGLLGGIIVLVFVICGIVAPILAPYDPLVGSVADRLRPPSAAHWFGTDEIGRDILSRLLRGATLSMGVAVSVVVVGVVVGVPFGALSGYLGGIFDLLLQRIIDTLQAFPGVLLIILIVGLVGPSLELAMLGLGLLAVPTYARLMRGSVLVIKQMAYVEAARATGCSGARIVARHIVPNALTPVIVQSSLQAASGLLLLAGISFLGLGAQPPTPEWGAMVASGRNYMRVAPHAVLFPGIAVAVVVLGLNLLGDALRDALDPRAQGAGRR